MSGSSIGPVLSYSGDDAGSGGGIFSFTNAPTGTISGTTVISVSGSTGVIFTNYGSMSGSSIGPVLSYSGDDAGSGGGIFSFTNAPTGTISGTTNISVSGSIGVIFTNYGSMSGSSIGPVLSYSGDDAGSGGGIFSFTNAPTGTISGTTNISVSGSIGVIFTNYGSMSGSSIGPVLSYSGDGLGTNNSYLQFFNAGTGTVTGGFSINAAGGLGIAFQNNGILSGAGPAGTILNVSGTGQLLASNFGTISGTWMVTGGNNDEIAEGSLATVGSINFIGGGGSNTLVNLGNGVGSITFTAGAGSASLYNYGDNVSQITLIGGSGINQLESFGADVGTITLVGGSGSNYLYAARENINTIIVSGGTGTNSLDIEGGIAQNVAFTGGASNDSVKINGQVTNNLTINGNGGNNSIELAGQINAPGLVTNITLGTTGNNVVILDGAVGTLISPVTILGGSGDDRYVVMPSLTGDVTLSAGHGNNDYVLADASATVTVNQTWLGTGDTSLDTLDFSSFRNSGINLDISSTLPQLEGPLTLRLTDGMGISNVIGTQFVDTILGNGRNNNLQGALYSQSGTAPPATAAANARTQWVLVDFDSYTPSGTSLHVYTAAERQAVLDQLNEFYRGSADPNSANPWYDVRFTQDPNAIPANLESANQFFTVYINATPDGGGSGGQSSKVDPGNENPSGWAKVQVNGASGGPFQPAETSANIVNLTASMGAHEVGHLLGMEHSDSLGPIGYGSHLPLYPGQPDPASNVAPAAFEALDNIISSPAVDGGDRFNDLGGQYFGEREDIKLGIAFADPSVVITTKQSAPTSLSAPQDVPLASIAVANTLGSSALNYGKKFLVTARQIDAQSTGNSDFYRFYATKGELINADAASVILGLPASATIDSTLILRDATGNVLVTNYHGFETSDAQIVDYLVQQSGYFTIEVASANGTPGNYRLTISTFEAINDPSAATGVDILKGGAGVNTFNAGPGVFYGLAITAGYSAGTSQAGNTFTRTVNFNDPGGYTWTATVDYGDGTGTVNLTPLQIDGVGQTLSLSHVFTTAGSHIVTVTLTDNNGLTDTKSFNVNVTPSNATRFAVTAPTTSIAGTTFSGTVTAFDAYGNLATGYQGTVELGASIEGGVDSEITLVAGVGTYSAKLKIAGNQVVTAFDENVPTLLGSATVNVKPAAAAGLVLSIPATDLSGTTVTATVTAIDAYGNVATGYTGTVGFSSSDSQATLPANSLLTSGSGSFTVTFRTAGHQAITVADTSFSSLSQTSTISVIPVVAPPQLISYSIQQGQLQRSYIRYLDLYFDTSVGLPNFVNGIGIKLTRYDINGQNPTVVTLTGLITISGNHVTIDFGMNGIGGNRLSNAGDGTYRLAMDLNGDGSFSTMIQFTRLYGDVNGDGSVDATDLSLFQAYLKTKNLNGDINGDSFVDTRDQTAIALAQGRKIKLPT